MNNQTTIQVAKGIAIASGIFILGFFIGHIVSSPLTISGEVSTWVGAIGSMAAVASGFILSGIQYRRARRDSRNEPLMHLQTVLEHAAFLIGGVPRTDIRHPEMVIRTFLDSGIYRYRQALTVLNAHPALLDPFAMDALLKMREAMTKLCSLAEPIFALEDNSQREEVITYLYEFDECEELSGVAILYLQMALDGAGIK